MNEEKMDAEGHVWKRDKRSKKAFSPLIFYQKGKNIERQIASIFQLVETEYIEFSMHHKKNNFS